MSTDSEQDYLCEVSPMYFTFVEQFFIEDDNNSVVTKQKQVCDKIKQTIDKINEIKTIDTFLENLQKNYISHIQ